MNDLRYALRTLAKNPGFATVAVLTLALGIGANTAIFSVVNGVLLSPLPFGESEQIVLVATTTKDEESGTHAAADFEDLRRENQSLEAIAGYRTGLFTATVRPGEPVQLEGAHVTVDFFDVLDVPAALGRTFTRASDAPPGERLVVLSDEAWRQLYAGSEGAIGHRLRVDGEPHTVLGVLPAGAEWPDAARIWVLSQKGVPPSPIELNEATSREVRYFEAIARLRQDVTLEQAGQDMNRLAAILQQRRATTSQPRGIRLSVLREEIVGDVRDGLLVMQAAVGLVLLIACANVSSLLIARATGRRRELAIRAAMGAGRGRLIRQLLAESVLLGVIGGLCGLLAGAWMTVMLVGVLPDGVPRAAEIELDRVVAIVTLAAALATSVLFGVMPALQASQADAGSALKRGGERGSSGRARARAALVVAEVALTLVLLAGAGLLLNSFLRLQQVESGMQPENVTVASIVVPETRYPTSPAQMDVYRRVLEGLSARPEVRAVGIGFPGPLRGSNASGAFFVEGRPTSDPADRPFANIGSVSGGFFSAMGIPLIAGRTFAESDSADSPEVAVVSAALARKYWPGENAVGRRVTFDDNTKDPWRVIVGVVGDVRQLGLDQDAPPILYIPYEQFPLPFTNIAVRSSLPSSTVAALVRAQLSAVDPELPPGDIVSLQTVLERSVAQPRFRTMLIAAFAVVALTLAAVGVFGLISYSVTQRTREIGIRIALGAQPRQVLAPMLREGLLLAGLGLGIGLAGALIFARVLSSFLFGIGATDPLTYAVVSIVLLSVAFLATYIPSRRALRIDPITALRTE